MKKFIVVIMCCLCCTLLCACGGTPAENTVKNLTNVTSQLQGSIAKIKTTNQNELASLSISPDIESPDYTIDYAKFYKSNISPKISTSGERANLDNYILKLEEIYKINIEVLNKNASINKLRSELDEKINQIKEECENIKRGLIIVTKKDEEYINSCIRALRRTAENLENKKQYFNTAKQKFVNADLNEPEIILVKANTLLAEMDSVYVDLNFATSTLDTTISILTTLEKTE